MSKSKTVAGQDRKQTTFSAASRALADGKLPSYVDHWLEWFDETPCDLLPEKSGALCGDCINKAACDASQNKSN